MRVEDVAEHLGVSSQWVRHWIRTGELGSVRFGHRTLRVTSEQFAIFVEERSRPAESK